MDNNNDQQNSSWSIASIRPGSIIFALILIIIGILIARYLWPCKQRRGWDKKVFSMTDL